MSIATGKRASYQRRGRGILCWAVGTFVVGQLAAGAVIDYLTPGIKFPELARLQQRMAAEPPADVVMFGSSRLLVVDDAAMNARLANRLPAPPPRVFNAAVTAGDPVASERILTEWLERRGRPRLVILEIQPESINHRDAWLEGNALRQFDWPDSIAAAPSLLRNGLPMGLIRGRMLPVFLHRYRIRKELNAYLFESPESTVSGPVRAAADLEIVPAPPPPTAEFIAQTAQAAHGIAKMVRDFDPTGYTARRLEQTLRLCQAENIEVVLVMPPLTVGHRNGYDERTNARLREYLARLRARFGASCVDFRSRLGDEYLGDSNHLNAAGAKVFARMLTDEVILPRWPGPDSTPPGYGTERRTLTAGQNSPSKNR